MGLAIERPTLEIFFGAIVDYAPAQNHQVHRLRTLGNGCVGFMPFHVWFGVDRRLWIASLSVFLAIHQLPESHMVQAPIQVSMPVCQ